MVIGAREEAIILAAVGVAVIAADLVWWHQTWLLIAALMLTALLAVSLVTELRKGPDWRRQEMMIRSMWKMASRMPAGQTLRDPVTGAGVAAVRDRGTIVLVVVDPPPVDRATAVEATKTTYVLGSGWAPDPPPLIRYTTPAGQSVPVRRRFRNTQAMLHFNRETGGALQVDTEDLADLEALMVCAVSSAS